MRITIKSLDKKASTLLFTFLMDSIPSDKCKDLSLYLEQHDDSTFCVGFNILKTFITITLHQDIIEIENQRSICKIPRTEFTHIEVF